MRDNEARLTSIYVAPAGSRVPSYSPNSEDTPAGSFDLIICGEAGDEITHGHMAYKLSYWAVDLFTMNPVGNASFHAIPNVVPPQTFGDAHWTARTPAKEDYWTMQTFNIPVPAGLGLSGHILQFYAVLTVLDGDIVSFVQSEPFVLV